MATFTGNASNNTANAQLAVIDGFTVTGGSGSDLSDLQDLIGDLFFGDDGFSTSNDTIVAGAGDDTIRGMAGSDSVNGGDGSDIFEIYGGELDTGDTIIGGNGGSNVDAIVANAPLDFSGIFFSGIEEIRFAVGLGDNTQTFRASDLHSKALNFVGSNGADTVRINLASSGSSDLSGIGVSNWTAADRIEIDMSPTSGSVVGTGAADIFLDVGAFDVAEGGQGDDIFRINPSSTTVAGRVIYGGSGFDTIQLSSAVTGTQNFDLTQTPVTSIERLLFTPNGASGALVFTLASQMANGGEFVPNLLIDTPALFNIGIFISMGGNTSLDLSQWQFTAQDAIRIIIGGDSSSETVIGSSEGDVFQWGGGQDTFNGGGGFDNLILDPVNPVLAGNFDGGSGINTLEITAAPGAVYDVTDATVTNFGRLQFGAYRQSGPTPFTTKLVIDSTQVSLSQIVHDYQNFFFGPADVSIVEVVQSSPGDLDLSGWVFGSWGTGEDYVRVLAASGGGTITGTSRDDRLEGGSGFDSLRGGDGNDTLIGGASNDALVGGAGADSLVGGVDRAAAYYDASPSGVTVNLRTGVGSGGHAQGDVLSDISAITGSAHADILIGNASVSTWLLGGGGNDSLVGSSAFDVLHGDDQDDTIDGGGSGDSINGGNGSDTITYANSLAGVIVNLTTGIHSGGDAQGDGLGSIENVVGSLHADTIVGSDLANRLEGGSGAGIDRLEGRGGNDNLLGFEGNDTLFGGEGNDTLGGGAGADSLDGGNGTDTAGYAASDAGVTVNLTTGTGVGGHAQGDVLVAIEHVIGSAHNDVLTGNTAANILDGFGGHDNIVGGDGNDTLLGGEGNDTLGGGVGADSLVGGNGIDWSVYVASTAGVTVNLTSGTGVGGYAQGDILVGIENVTGSNLADVLTGSVAANILDGLGGHDNIVGGDGNDTLLGGEGNDTLGGGVGADSLNGGNGSDWSVYVASTAGVTVNLTSGTGVGGYAQGDILVGIENVTGSNLADVLTGSVAANILDGLGGHDNIVGGDGNDTLLGGEGNDTLGGGVGADSLVGGNGSDWSVYVASTAGITVNLSGGAGVGGFAQGDIFVGIENIVGSVHADFITGNTAANTFDGGAGNDTLVGGAAADVMAGGADADVFRFAALADSGTTVGTRDVILDFVSGQDKFGVVLIDAIAGGGDDAFTFVGTGPFTAAGQVRYRFEDPVGTVNDKTIVEFNVDGVLAADMTIELRGLVTLAANDFLL